MFCEPERVIFNENLPVDMSAPTAPAEFSSIESAYESIFQILLWRYVILHRGETWSSTSPGFLLVRSSIQRWFQSLSRLQARLGTNEVEQYHRIDALRGRVRVLNGSVLYSVRDDIPTKTLCRPTLVYVSLPDKFTIFTNLERSRKVNLSGMNGCLYPWPHAKRVRVFRPILRKTLLMVPNDFRSVVPMATTSWRWNSRQVAY